MSTLFMIALAVMGQRNIEPAWQVRQRYQDELLLRNLRATQNEARIAEEERRRQEESDPEFQKRKAAKEKAAQNEALAAKREKICAAEAATIEKAIGDMAKSVKNLSDPSEFNRDQARKGIERNSSKMMASIVKLRENGMPPATLAKLKSRVEESISQGKSALAKVTQ